MDLEIKTKALTKNAWILFLKGSIDATNAETFRDQVCSYLQDGARHLLLEMSRVKYLSSSGISAFVAIKQRAVNSGGSMVVFGLQNAVRRVLEIIKWNDLEVTSETLEAGSPFLEFIRKREAESAQTEPPKTK